MWSFLVERSKLGQEALSLRMFYSIIFGLSHFLIYPHVKQNSFGILFFQNSNLTCTKRSIWSPIFWFMCITAAKLSQWHRRSQDFWLGGGGQTTNHMQWRHQKFSKKELLWGKNTVEWKIWSHSLMALNRILVKGRGRKLIVKKCKCLTLEDMLNKVVYSNASQTGVWGPEPPSRRWLWGSGGKAPSCWAIFVSFWKKSYLNPIRSQFARVQSHFKELDF